MRITPMDIRQQQFTVKMFRGFDTQEVDTFLEDLASETVAAREKVLQETLMTTQRLVEEMKENARREAGVIIREAESQADRIIDASRKAEGDLHSEIQALRRMRRELAESLRATVEMYQRLLEQDLKTNAEDAEPPNA